MQQQIKRKTQKDSLVKEDWSISGETTTRALRKSNPTPTKPIQYLGVLWGELDGGGALYPERAVKVCSTTRPDFLEVCSH